MRFFASTLLFILSVTQFSEASDSLSLDDLIKLTMKNQPAITAATAQSSAAKTAVNEVRASYFPQISLQAIYNNTEPVNRITIPGSGGISINPPNFYDIHFNISQSIFEFGQRRYSVKISEQSVKTSSNNVFIARSDLAYQTVNTFYTILLARKTAEVIDEQINSLNKHLSYTRQLRATGSATDYDVYTVQVRIASATSNKIDALETEAQQEFLLSTLTGLPVDSVKLIKGDITLPVVVNNSDSLIKIAKECNPQVRAARIAEQIASLETGLARSQRWPTLGARFLPGFKNGYIPNLNRLQADYLLGVELNVPIFNGLRTLSQVNEAHERLKAAQQNTRAVEIRIEYSVNEAITRLKYGLEKLSTTEPSIKQAQDALTVASVRYKTGGSTILDLLDAQTSLANAQLMQIRAIYEIQIADFALKQVTGEKIW
jgi:outer membrane protein